MARDVEAHAYLAGPDVFFPDAIEVAEQKKAKLAKVGIKGHFPFDNKFSPTLFEDLHHASHVIARSNEQMMHDCCKEGRVGIILANMTPFHGPSMDIGTAFEAGFMSALAEMKKNVIIIGYTNDKRTFEERVINDVHGGKAHLTEKDGRLYAPDGIYIEAFGCADNLMITHAIEKTGGQVVHSFDEAVKLAKTLSDQKINELSGPARFKAAGKRKG